MRSSLGVAYFNAKQFDKAVEPLSRARDLAPGDANVRRMLALSCLNAEQYDKAAELLRNDPQRDTDPSLQYAYGLALVRTDRGADAEIIFDQLLAAHADNAEVNVLLGQAHAQQGDYDAALKSLQRALQIKPDVAEANAALGVIYLRQGKLTEAADALRAELKIRPDDLQARFHLATVFDRSDQRDEALAIVQSIVRVKPDYADAGTCSASSCSRKGTRRRRSITWKRPRARRRTTPTSFISSDRPIRSSDEPSLPHSSSSVSKS